MTLSRPSPALVGEVSARSTGEETWQACEQLLQRCPSASVMAVSSTGLFVPMPTSVSLLGHSIIEGHASPLELVAPDMLGRVIETWKRALATGLASVDVEPLAAPGSTMTVHFFDVRNRHGVLLLVGVQGGGPIPVSDLRGPDDAMRPRVSVVRKNEFSEFIDLDGAFELILGYPRAELLGSRSLDLVHPDDHTRAIANWMDMLGGAGRSRRVRMRIRHRDGHWVWFELTNHNRLNDVSERAVLTEMIDISDEMSALESLRAREQLLDRLTETLPLGVLTINGTGSVLHRNARVAELLQPGPGDTMADVFAGVSDGGTMLREALARTIRDGADDDLEVAVRRGDGAEIWCRVLLRGLTDDAGRPAGGLICVEDVTEGVQLREHLHAQATHDALTGCYNRSAILEITERALAEAARNGTGVAVAFIDLDGLKAVNDRRGHAAGDALLTGIAACLRSATRPEDAIGRLGGDEFLVVAPGARSRGHTLELGSRLAAALAAAGRPQPPNRAVASIGLAWTAGVDATLPTDRSHSPADRSQSPAEQLIALADAAMYDSKADGRGRPVLAIGT